MKKKFQLDNVITTFTQNGIFLHRSIIKDLKLSEGDPIYLRLLSGNKILGETLTFVNDKSRWNLTKEKKIYGKDWYSDDVINKIMKYKRFSVLGYLEWDCLSFWWRKSLPFKELTLEIESILDIEDCKKVSIMPIIGEEPIDTNGPNLMPPVLETGKIIRVWPLDNLDNVKINRRKYGLSYLPGCGPKKKALLKTRGINSLFKVLSSSISEISDIEGISKKTAEFWITSASKVAEPDLDSLSCQVMSTDPEAKTVKITKKTEFIFDYPYYAQLFVKGHPRINKELIEKLGSKLKEDYKVMEPLTGLPESLSLSNRKNNRTISIYGPWVVTMIGYPDIESVKEDLSYLEFTMQYVLNLWGDVVTLIEPQKRIMDTDQIVDSIVKKFSPDYSDMGGILYLMRTNEELVLDTNIIIDGRISSLIIRATLSFFELEEYEIGKPTIIIPLVSAYEIKSMVDRYKKKDIPYTLGAEELQRLRALNDAGYITLVYDGELPPIPHISKDLKGLWQFIASIRDEYILPILEKRKKARLITSDKNLAVSAYARKYNLVLIRPLEKELREFFSDVLKKFKSLSSKKKEENVKIISKKLKVPVDTLRKVIDKIAS
jgi:hypothetical protein